MKTALLLIDIQNDYFPGGKFELKGSVEAAGKAKQALSLFREKNLPVFHIQHLSLSPAAPFFIPGAFGVELHEEVKPIKGETVIQKNFPNSFRNTSLLDELRKSEVNHLVIAGMMTHMCVEAASRAAFDLGFKLTLLYDACATRDLQLNGKLIPAQSVHDSILAALNGSHGTVIFTDELKLD